MKRDTTLFAQDLKVEVSGDEIPYDTSHIYTGEIYGKTVIPGDLLCSLTARCISGHLIVECFCDDMI